MTDEIQHPLGLEGPSPDSWPSQWDRLCINSLCDYSVALACILARRDRVVKFIFVCYYYMDPVNKDTSSEVFDARDPLRFG
jgi:hypothetical protein